MIKPGQMKKGDKIALVAPSRKVSPTDVEPAITRLEEWGLKVVRGEHLFSDDHSYLSGTDEQRLHDLQSALNDPTIKAIIAARGGYGSTRIIDQLDFTAFRYHPKWIIGFSDITALHLKLLHQSAMSIHGTMPILFSKPGSTDSVESLKRVMFTGEYTIHCNAHPSNRNGTAQGTVIGGNLSLVVDSLGTSSEPDTSSCILVVEEIDEYKYRLDRMLTQLKRAGKLSNLKGLVVGHMTDIKDSELPFGISVESIILDAVGQYHYPVAFGFPSGHENPNLAWIHGGTATLNVSKEKTVMFSTSLPA